MLTAMRWCIGGPQVDPSLLGRFGDYGAKVEAVASGYFGGRPLSSTVRLNVPKKRSPARKGLFVDWDDAEVSGAWHEMLGGIDAESFAQIYSMSGEQLHLGGDIESVVSRLMHSASGTNFDPMERAAALREAARVRSKLQRCMGQCPSRHLRARVELGAGCSRQFICDRPDPCDRRWAQHREHGDPVPGRLPGLTRRQTSVLVDSGWYEGSVYPRAQRKTTVRSPTKTMRSSAQ